MNATLDQVIAILGKEGGLRKSPTGWMARCPVHKDRNPSLSVAEGRDQPVVLFCQAGCDTKEVERAIGVALSAPRRHDGDDRFVAIYDYRDEQGELLFQVCRTADKKFLQRRPVGTGWTWQLGDTRRVLYRLPKVLAAVQECREIYICEGEKDVHTLESIGLVATCNSGGAGKWKPEYTEALHDAVVIIVADKDNPGRAHARMVREALAGVAADITVAEAAGDEKVKDVTDHFAAGHTLDDLVITYTTAAAPKPVAAVELWAFLDASDSPPDWVIPGLLERGDRLILTGYEGLGKSMLVRQLAICAAAGLHPFDTDYRNNYQPQKVLFIDCENSETQGRRKMRPIAYATKGYNRTPNAGQMFVVHRPGGIDLATRADAAFVIEQVTAHKPDLLIIGPFYKLHAGDINKEENARRVTVVLDEARAISNAALVTEAHAGHGEAGKSRAIRPAGSSLLLRWPEFGYGLVPNAMANPSEDRCRQVDVLSWRGPRDDRDWPRHLEYGPNQHHLPWQPWDPPKEAKPK